MEQISFFRKSSAFILVLLSFVVFIGCKSKEEHPELLDPIYRDLQTTLSEYSSTVADSEKEIETLKKEIDTYEPNTKELHLGRKQLREAKDRLAHAKQMERYLKIRVARRRVEDLKSYSLAFEKEEAWPDPNEYAAYLANKKLSNSKRQWDARIPKLHSRLEEYKEAHKEPESANSGH